MFLRVLALSVLLLAPLALSEQVFSRITLDTSLGGVCLDGSPAVAYYWQPTPVPPTPKIILFLQGGGCE